MCQKKNNFQIFMQKKIVQFLSLSFFRCLCKRQSIFNTSPLQPFWHSLPVSPISRVICLSEDGERKRKRTFFVSWLRQIYSWPSTFNQARLFLFFCFRELFPSCSFVTKKMGPTIWDLHRKGDQWQEENKIKASSQSYKRRFVLKRQN